MSGIPNYLEHTRAISANLATLRSDQPDLMKAFGEMAAAATRDGALSKKTKELIALALGVAAHCDACIGFHAKALVALAPPWKRWKKPWAWPCTWEAARLSCIRPMHWRPLKNFRHRNLHKAPR